MIEDRRYGFIRLGKGAFGKSKERIEYFSKFPHWSFRKTYANFE